MKLKQAGDSTEIALRRIQLSGAAISSPSFRRKGVVAASDAVLERGVGSRPRGSGTSHLPFQVYSLEIESECRDSW